MWESINHAETWARVDGGSFPANTVRVVHDPANCLISYALTDHGLFVSQDRGASWQVTSLIEGIHGLVFVDRETPLSRALVVGTDTGVKVSVDEAVSWIDMSSGLLAQPHTVTYGHDQLIATSDSGYFTCNTVDCAGLAQPLEPEEERGIVDVIEFYNTDLDHYFMTASEADVVFIEQGLAGPGWIRTGEEFLAWSLGSGNPEITDVCRFYGSVYPGPNSHFFSVSPPECRTLMILQEVQPADQPRWNFEGYAFSILPPSQDDQQPCPEDTIPVYRAYNNGYDRGEDSNHRYFTDLNLLIPLLDKGWSDEGVTFCSPLGAES
ncbi:MAG: hypothetical protein GQ563_07135 [Desulfuromusa sp.]|nr:hypothetical protein [Desulfuromusa sp.]